MQAVRLEGQARGVVRDARHNGLRAGIGLLLLISVTSCDRRSDSHFDSSFSSANQIWTTSLSDVSCLPYAYIFVNNLAMVSMNYTYGTEVNAMLQTVPLRPQPC